MDKSGHTISSSVRSCHRIGKFDSGRTLPRLLLVVLSSTVDVHNILSKCHQLPSTISIEADLSHSARKAEYILLKKR